MNLQVNGRPLPEKGGANGSSGTLFPLVTRIARRLEELAETGGADNPIRQRSGQALFGELAKEDGRTQLELVNATGLKAPTVSVTLQKMEKEGYITRNRDQNDLRATRVFLSDKGRGLIEMQKKGFLEIESRLFDSLGAKDSEAFLSLLLKTEEALSTMGPR